MRVMRGRRTSAFLRRGVSSCVRSVALMERSSQRAGRGAIPKYCTRDQRNLPSIVKAESSPAYPKL